MAIFYQVRENLVAWVAIVISLFSFIYPLYLWFQGPDIKFFPPKEVVFHGIKPPGNLTEVVTISAGMTYLNSGGLNYNGVLMKESVEFSISGKDYELGWLWFGPFVYGKKMENILEEKHTATSPVIINGKSAISHETFFSPRRHFCAQGMRNCDNDKIFLNWNDFIKKLEVVTILDLTFKTEISGHYNEIAHCRVEFDAYNIRRLKNLKYDTIPCVPET